MHPALLAIRDATRGTPFERDLWLVGGAVRDELLGLPAEADFDLVTQGSAIDLARLIYERGGSNLPVTYERFGTAMVQVEGASVELVTARRESYDHASRKPTVEAASLEEDALRRDFTVNTLMRNLASGELFDPLGIGLRDLGERILRTPLDPAATFHDDPLRMLRAVRFRWKLGFEPVAGLYEAIRAERERLRIVSMERIRDEFVKMLLGPEAPSALDDLMDLGLYEVFAPEFLPMVGCEQGNFHHLDVWRHSLLVLSKVDGRDLVLRLGALLHDVGKPPTRFVDADGNVRFFGHETVGADIAREVLGRLKFPGKEIDLVVRLVRNHMRLGSSPFFTPAAARRLLRDFEGDVERLLELVEADAASLRPGVRALDLSQIRDQIERVAKETPVKTLQSPLSGQEIMEIAQVEPGPEVGRLKSILTEAVLEGTIPPDDKEAASRLLRQATHPS
ncbi:MAG TPA: HD domain-containing protein [Fimbriimonas sp.]